MSCLRITRPSTARSRPAGVSRSSICRRLAGIAHPSWDFEADRPLDLVVIALTAMDVTLAEERYFEEADAWHP